MRVSVITPTFHRHRLHPHLVRCFTAQTYPDLELLIADDTPSPSTFLHGASAADPRIKYFHTAPMSCGAKRNFLIEQASGDCIVHFDDDDYYAPHYVALMVQRLQPVDLVKLTAWYNYSAAHKLLLYWDTRSRMKVHYHLTPEGVRLEIGVSQRALTWGYGFSYVYRRAKAMQVRFADMTAGEDFDFFHRFMAAGNRVEGFADVDNVAIHLIHQANTSSVLPQYALPPFLMDRLFPEVRQQFDALQVDADAAQIVRRS